MKASPLVVGLAVGCYLMHIHSQDVKVQDYTAPPPPSHVQKDAHPVLSMSDEEFAKFVAKQNPHDPIRPEPDTVVHWSPEFQKSLLPDSSSKSSSSSTSGEQAILSGNANFTGQSSDTGSTEVTDSTPLSAIPVGYHLVHSYTTKKGKHVKAHLVRNRSKSTTSTNWSTPSTSRSHDVQQRVLISHQNFPNATISTSDPTIIIGTH
jgi:hypothetical protein